MIEKWYYLDDKKSEKERQQGPYPLYMIELLAKNGNINPETLVWHQGLSQWTPWEQVAPKPEEPELEKENAEKTEKDTSVDKEVEVPVQKIPKPELQAKYASFGLRLAAILADLLILGMVNAILLLIYTVVFRIPEQSLMESRLIHIPSLFIDACYQIWFMWQYGGTPGKMLVGLRIVTDTGQKLSLPRSFSRYFAFLLNAMTLGIGFIIVMLDPKRRALHDHLAKTRVVHAQYGVKYEQE
ncbi:MAG: RDD family protein [Fibrobacter sp.]|nr:RDD family protein [Fibrobacter sp.]